MVIPGPGKVELSYTPADGGTPIVLNVYDFKGKSASGGVALAMYNTEEVYKLLKIYVNINLIFN